MIKQCRRCGAKFRGSDVRCPLDDGEFDELPDPLLGRVLAQRYRVDACIGSGGMGAVYRARHLAVGRDVALKVLDESLASNAVFVKRFAREARASNMLKHENIVEIHDICQEGTLVFLVMELLRGESLGSRIADDPMPHREVIDVGVAVASALARSHALGVVHRDVKPENIFLCDDGGRARVRVLDFGVAHVRQEERLTMPGQVLGTPEYMAPEQITGQCSPASDLYSLGITMFHALAGRLPFEGSHADVTVMHLRAAPPALQPLCPTAPPALCALVMSLLAKKPVDRPASAYAVMDELRRLQQSLRPRPTQAPPPTDARSDREALLRVATAAAYPSGSMPPWVARALEDLAAQVNAVQSLEREALGLGHEIARAEELGRQEYARQVSALDADARELAALERADLSSQRALGSLRDRAVTATATLSRAWLAAKDSVGAAWDPTPDAADAMVALGRDAADYRGARAAFDACDAEARSRAAKIEAVEARCDAVRMRLAAADDESRRRVSALREQAAALGASIAGHHAAFAAQADALERHLAAYGATSAPVPAA